MVNAVTIDIEVNEKVVQQGSQAGTKFTESFERALVPIDRAFDKTVRAIANQLDKVEQEAWQTGKGMDDAFGTAMSGMRRSLELVQTEARETGAGLNSSIGTALKQIKQSAAQLADGMKPVKQATVEVNQAFDKTARLVKTELDRMERDAWLASKGTDQAFQTALKSVRDDFDRVADVGRRTGARLESDLGGSLRDIKREMDRLGAEAKETGQEIQRELGGAGEGIGDTLGESIAGGFDLGGLMEGLGGKAGLGAGAAAAGGAIGTVLAEQAFSALEGYLQERSIGGLIAAQSGSTVREGLRLGQLVGENFADGFGTSIEDVGAAASAAIGKGLVDMDAPQQVLDEIIELATTAAEVTGKSADELASAIRVMLKTGLADNAQEAFDLITTGFQRGADAGGDMVEELTRSSANLKQFGFDGQTTLGMFKQALDAGAPSADAFTGALEELVGNANDGIPIFERLGLGGKEFADQLVGGGPPAAAAMDKLLDRIRAIESPAERSAAMVSLFGEEATAMQGAILAVDPSEASKLMDDFAGSTDLAAKKIQATRDPMEAAQRSWMDFLQGPLDDMDTMFIEGEESAFRASGALKDFKNATDEGEESASSYARSLQEIITGHEQMATGVIGLSEAQIGWHEALNTANEDLKENGKNLDIATEKGQSNQSNLNDIASSTWDVVAAMEQQGATTQEVQGYVASAREEFVSMATRMGMGADAANALADKLGLIPGDYNARINADTGQALGAINAVRNALNSLPSRVTTVINSVVNTVRGNETGGSVGFGIWGAATGGVRHSSTMINESGPEVVELPTGSRVMTAGATRAMAEAGAFGGGGGGPITIQWAGGPSDDLGKAIWNYFRDGIAVRYGGSAQAALGQAGAA